jgi:hypothetical protein
MASLVEPGYASYVSPALIYVPHSLKKRLPEKSLLSAHRLPKNNVLSQNNMYLFVCLFLRETEMDARALELHGCVLLRRCPRLVLFNILFNNIREITVQ